jgi:hypothetical protein
MKSRWNPTSRCGKKNSACAIAIVKSSQIRVRTVAKPRDMQAVVWYEQLQPMLDNTGFDRLASKSLTPW